ncbi:hypothetical protein HSX11_06920 [Oxalobacteraceae bacterium]|nr:hypothetical protein [Oxalobacteraceae bacterium]
MGKSPEYLPLLGRFEVSTDFVDNFVDKGKLIPGNGHLSACPRQPDRQKAKFTPFKINDLEIAS